MLEIESESFKDLHYVIKDKHIILMSNQSGKFACSLKVLPELIQELKEIQDVWGDTFV